MDNNDRQAIEGLFGRLSQVEREAGPRDEEAECLIRDSVANQPAAPYFMAQTIVVQEQALNAAQSRIEELEYQASRQSSGGGGLFASLFGGGSRPAPQQSAAAQRPMPVPPAAQAGPWNQNQGQQRGGGFLAGAAQTAMGVAGGVLLGNAIAGMFAGPTEANAAEPETPAEEPADTGGMDDMGGGDFDF